MGYASIPHERGRAALAHWAAAPEEAPRSVMAMAVRYTLAQLAQIYPGRSVEVRVPPFGAVHILEGTTHRRGTPPAVVEMPPGVWLSLATGRRMWNDAVASADVRASGQRSNLADILPITAYQATDL